MGIYVFNREVLIECLKNDLADFGKHIIPQSIQDRRVNAYIFKGYWEDIGTIRAFFEANLDLTKTLHSTVSSKRMRRFTRIRAFFPEAKLMALPCDRRSSRTVASFQTRTSSGR